MLEDVAHEGVAALVVGDGGALLGGDHAALALGAGHHALHGLLDLVGAHALAAAPGGEKRRLVAEVRQIGAGEAWGDLCQSLEVDGLGEGLVCRVDAQDLLAAAARRGGRPSR